MRGWLCTQKKTERRTEWIVSAAIQVYPALHIIGHCDTQTDGIHRVQWPDPFHL